MHMGEVILTADRLTQAEAKRVSKDLIGELAPIHAHRRCGQRISKFQPRWFVEDFILLC